MDVNVIKAWFEIIAIGLAGIFFIVRTLGGFFYVNLSLSLEGERRPATEEEEEEEEEDLAITAKVAKLKNGGIRVHSASARITDAGPSGSRLCDGELKSTRRMEDIHEWREAAQHLKFSPEEATEFGFFCRVPKDVACLVEVLIVGRGSWRPKPGQWRVSKVVLAAERKG